MAAVVALKVLILASSTIWKATAAQFAKGGSAEVLYRGRGVAELSDASFQSSVLKDDGARSVGWLVLFCKEGDARCASLMPSLVNVCQKAAERTPTSEIGLVRVAKVDCGAHADLCTEQGVTEYPTVAHYHQQEVAGNWTPGKEGLHPWLQREILLKGGRDQSLKKMSSKATPKTNSKQVQNIAALVSPVCTFSHLKEVHEWILLEDCLFAQVLSFMLLVAILGKAAWIIIDGGELKFWSKDLFVMPSLIEAPALVRPQGGTWF